MRLAKSQSIGHTDGATASVSNGATRHMAMEESQLTKSELE